MRSPDRSDKHRSRGFLVSRMVNSPQRRRIALSFYCRSDACLSEIKCDPNVLDWRLGSSTEIKTLSKLGGQRILDKSPRQCIFAETAKLKQALMLFPILCFSWIVLAAPAGFAKDLQGHAKRFHSQSMWLIFGRSAPSRASILAALSMSALLTGLSLQNGRHALRPVWRISADWPKRNVLPPAAAFPGQDVQIAFSKLFLFVLQTLYDAKTFVRLSRIRYNCNIAVTFHARWRLCCKSPITCDKFVVFLSCVDRCKLSYSSRQGYGAGTIILGSSSRHLNRTHCGCDQK